MRCSHRFRPACRAALLILAVAGCGSAPLTADTRDGAAGDLGPVGPLPGEPGAPCVKNADCHSLLCLAIGRCTRRCKGPADCPPAPSWSCEPLAGAGDLCQCTPSGAEVCDGKDNDCNSLVDDTAACPAGRQCQNGQCRCMFDDCGGACVDLRSDRANCGACGHACTVAGEVCQAGICACPGGGVVCAGACVDVQNDVANCGGCAVRCGPAGQVCQAGRCTCPNGGAICSNACVDLLNDAANCGSCGTVCPKPQQSCQAASCRCVGGGTACGPSCVDLQNDSANCGACGNRCAAGMMTCQAGRCACIGGGTACGMSCVNLQNDPANCGACGNRCLAPPETCVAGQCFCGAPGLKACGNRCVDVLTDEAACGGCGNVCDLPMEECQGGQCVCIGLMCNGICVYHLGDNGNCGACGNLCALGALCDNGTCRCTRGDLVCNGICWDSQNDRIHCGSCGNSCDPNFGLCQGGKCTCGGGTISCAGRCTDPLSDPANCGGCGISCGLDRCQFGHCEETLAWGLPGPTGVAVGTSYVYWINQDGDSVMRVAKGGGGLATIAVGQSQPRGIAADDNAVYWTNGDGSVRKYSIQSAVVTTVATGQTGAAMIAVDAQNAYWTNEVMSGDVMAVPVGGGPATPLVTLQDRPFGIATDGRYVYFAAGGLVQRVSALGGNPVLLAAVPLCRHLAVDAQNVYVTTTDGKVLRLPSAGGAPVELSSGWSSFEGVAADGQTVYFAVPAALFYVPLFGGSQDWFAATDPRGLALDQSYVYWSYGKPGGFLDGAILRRLK